MAGFKRTRRTQPQGAAQLDRSNPLTKQAAFVTLGSVGREIVNNLAILPSGTTLPNIKPFGGKLGSGLANNFPGGSNASGYLDLGVTAQTADIGLNVPATWVAVFSSTSAATTAIAERNDHNSVNAGWVFGYTGQTPGLGLLKEFAAANLRKTISNAILPGVNVLVVTYDGGLLASGVNVYLNGVIGTTAASVDGSGATATDAAQNLYVGRVSFDQNVGHAGFIMLAGAFRRLWSPGEVKAFSDNPWQLFQSPARLLVDQPAAGGAVSASSATTDGADVFAAQVAPIIAASSATTDGADVLAAAVNNSLAANSASSSTTDGADVLSAAVAPIVSASSAKTDGADVLSASLSVIVAASSATTDGADILAAQVAPIVAASSATTDGADVLLANVSNSLGVSASSATTDGADVLAASLAPIVAASSATTDGADVLASSVAPIVSASSVTTDGADVLLANVDTAVGAVSLSSATVDGGDIWVINAAPVVGVISTTTDGADILFSIVSIPGTASSIGNRIAGGLWNSGNTIKSGIRTG